MFCTDSNELSKMYWGEKKSTAHIATLFGVTPSAVLRRMEKLKIQRRSYSEANILRYLREPPVTTWHLYRLYILEKKSTRQIAREVGMAQSSVRRWMKRYKIPARKGGSPLKYPRESFSGYEREKAYLLGLRAGDISALKRTPNTVEVSTSTTHPAMITLFYQVFGKYGHCSRGPRKSNIGYEWALYCGLDTSFEFLKDKPTELPKEDELFYSFLAGYIDAEGCWKIAPSHHVLISFGLIISAEDLEILNSIREKLKNDGYHPSFRINNRKSRFKETRPLYELSLSTRSEVVSLIERILPLIQHREKIEKMRLILQMKDEKYWEVINEKVKALREQIKNEVDECVKEARTQYELRHKNPTRGICLSKDSGTLGEFAIPRQGKFEQNQG